MERDENEFQRRCLRCMGRAQERSRRTQGELQRNYEIVYLKKQMLIFFRKMSYRSDGKMHYSADAKDGLTERSEDPGSGANQVVVHDDKWGYLVIQHKSINFPPSQMP